MENNIEEQIAARMNGGVAPQNIKTISELLNGKFSPDEMVTIKNTTDKTTFWVYSDRKETTIDQVDKYTQHVQQGPQKYRKLEPNETLVIPGWEAHVALTQIFKEHMQATGRTSSINSPAAQAEFLAKAFIGIYDPNKKAEKPKSVKAEVDEDLGLKNEKKA